MKMYEEDQYAIWFQWVYAFYQEAVNKPDKWNDEDI